MSNFCIFVSSTCSYACFQHRTPILYQGTGMAYAPMELMIFFILMYALSIHLSPDMYSFITISLASFSIILSHSKIPMYFWLLSSNSRRVLLLLSLLCLLNFYLFLFYNLSWQAIKYQIHHSKCFDICTRI